MNEIILQYALPIFLTFLTTIISGFFGLKVKQLRDQKRILEKASKASQNLDVYKTDQQNKFYTEILSEYQELRKCNITLQEQITSLQSEVRELRKQISFYEENALVSESREMLECIFNHSMAVPAWIHDITGNKWYLNDEYCKTFSVSRPSFWYPVNIFGQYDTEDALSYLSNDLKIVEMGTAYEIEERVRKQVLNPKSKDYIIGLFRKTPIMVKGRPYIVGKMLNIVEDHSTEE